MIPETVGITDRANLVTSQPPGSRQHPLLLASIDALSSPRLLNVKGDDLRFRQRLAGDLQRRMTTIVGTYLPDHEHEKADNLTIVLGGEKITREGLEVGIESPSCLLFLLYDADQLGLIWMVIHRDACVLPPLSRYL